ncbi:hypothetical protein [Microbacterium sulfonylureivorans]|uniref:hypothetical protein n=1 Tax=Microbacterium sulfonylureivorans TaxID=2486854 RepID=UPI000FD9D270|nr:hypothetical protein [Microbacterium sulfonylureivorans]
MSRRRTWSAAEVTLKACLGVGAVAALAVAFLVMVPGARTALAPLQVLPAVEIGDYAILAILLAVVGGAQLAALLAMTRRHPDAGLLAAGAGFCALLWTFAHLSFAPNGPLPAVLQTLGCLELGCLLILLGVVRPRAERVVSDPGRRR